MTPAPATSDELASLRAESAHLRRVNQELLSTVAELRATVERQQAHIDRLVRMTFGRRSERVAGPTLFDGLPDPEPTPPAGADAPPVPEPPTETQRSDDEARMAARGKPGVPAKRMVNRTSGISRAIVSDIEA